ncbi:MAG: type 1 glutamine amidotransferase [Rhizobiaceae bacterium]
MTKILIVEGNSGENIRAIQRSGLPLGSDKYRHALNLYAINAAIDVSIPYAPELQAAEIDITSYDAFALTGSGVKWSSRDPEAKPYLAHIEKILALGKPVIGSCWGMQTVIQVLGGNCAPNEKGTEIGLAENIKLSEFGRSHWVFEGMPSCFSSPCVHRDHVVDLPDTVKLLASNSVSKVQAISCTQNDVDFVGFQFHPELDLDHVKAVQEKLGNIPETHTVISSFPDPVPEIVSDEKLRTKVFGNWLRRVENKKAASAEAA